MPLECSMKKPPLPVSQYEFHVEEGVRLTFSIVFIAEKRGNLTFGLERDLFTVNREPERIASTKRGTAHR